ncbi:hypothetical protein FGIG_07686 [Fasciola gigantica]|uniref:Uncharacterized protein n=1 Tax=Fasciola gigantica TaxID=46835 RepID=A0A504Z6N6_FASGI|nr:hypothetical protein FGIG_07686 [Fasciola gigantica]
MQVFPMNSLPWRVAIFAGNDSRVNTLKGKLFEGHFRNNASFYFSICGLSSNLSGEVFLAGYWMDSSFHRLPQPFRSTEIPF